MNLWRLWNWDGLELWVSWFHEKKNISFSSVILKKYLFSVQHEDFQTKHAVNLLKRYRSSYLMFNDDIQGTAATTLAGVYGALKVKFA